MFWFGKKKKQQDGDSAGAGSRKEKTVLTELEPLPDDTDVDFSILMQEPPHKRHWWERREDNVAAAQIVQDASDALDAPSQSGDKAGAESGTAGETVRASHGLLSPHADTKHTSEARNNGADNSADNSVSNSADNGAEGGQEEVKEIRHTISAEETFTLAKDIYDIRCVIKSVYNNRAVIARRLNIVSITASAVFTLLYAIFIIFGGILSRLPSSLQIYAYILFGVYVAVIIATVVVTLCARGAKTKTVKAMSRALVYMRLGIRILSLAVSITAIALASSESYSASSTAWDVIVIVFSVIILVIQLIPLLFGGIVRMCRWLMSPVKVKHRFSSVALEWYDLISTDASPRTGIKRVPKKYLEDISRVTDDILIPALGTKYVNTIKPATLLAIAAACTDEDRPIVEGVLKSLFGYAAECGYVAEDPCKDLGFEGSVEEEIKKHKTLKERFMGLGAKVGKSALDKFINSSTDDKSKDK